MEQFALEAKKRDRKGTGAARAYRREGLIPAVVYGQGKEVASILVENKRLQALLRHHGSLIDLQIEGEERDRDIAALLKETQRHPISRQIISVDLQWVSLTEAVEIPVPVVLVGTAIGVSRDGGSLDQNMHEIVVSCLPTSIPQSIEVDIAGLEIGQTIHVRGIVPPENVTIVTSPEDAVATVMRPIRAEDIETQVEEGEAVEVVAAPAEEAAEEKAEE